MSGSMNLKSKDDGKEIVGFKFTGEITDELKKFCRKYKIKIKGISDKYGALIIEYVRPYSDTWEGPVPIDQWICIIGEHRYIYNDHFVKEQYEF